MVVAKEEGEEDDAVLRHRLSLSFSLALSRQHLSSHARYHRYHQSHHLTHDRIDIPIINHFISIASIKLINNSLVSHLNHHHHQFISIASISQSPSSIH